MFKTILKIAVLSATTITLLSACGAATKALNSAADDALNAALAKAEKRYLGNIEEIIADNGEIIQVYTDGNGNRFQVNLDDFGNLFQVKDDNGNPIPVDIDDFGNPILAAPTTAEICSGKDTWNLWIPPCDNDAGSIQRLHEICLNNPFESDLASCAWDDRYHDARLESCAVNFSAECEKHERCLYQGFDSECDEEFELEFYSQRIKFCNKQAKADNSVSACPSEPEVNYYGGIENQFLQGTADGLNTGSLRASISDATAPVVHILKLSDSDDGVAFFAGIAPDVGNDHYSYSYYAGILPDNNLGAPITQKSGTAVWQGTFSVINSDTLDSGTFRTDTDFDLEIDFAEGQLSASINGVEKNKNLDSGVIEWAYTNYRLSGIFADGKIKGEIHATYVLSDGDSWVDRARVQGLIGQDGAIGAFVPRDYWGLYAGGFVARPPSK